MFRVDTIIPISEYPSKKKRGRKPKRDKVDMVAYRILMTDELKIRCMRAGAKQVRIILNKHLPEYL